MHFICLATLLLQPNPPALILLDEPELGLHPFAICILVEMLEAVSKRVQVVLATQSVALLNHFAPQDVIVAENDGQKTSFNCLDEKNSGAGWMNSVPANCGKRMCSEAVHDAAVDAGRRPERRNLRQAHNHPVSRTTWRVCAIAHRAVNGALA
ncbi:MAG: AAA family ATPase [Nitrosomonas sp.]|nr:MAG: AAA family ATPase [Nitrosomonas sp.]